MKLKYSQSFGEGQLLVGVLLGFFLAVVFVPDSALTLYFAWACGAVVLIWSIYKFSPWSRFVNGVLTVIGLAIIAVTAFYETEDRLRPGFVYIVPGFEIVGPQRAWAFLPKPKGPKTIFNAQITLIDIDKRDEVTRGKQVLDAADVPSYMTIVRYPEISKHNLNALSPKAIILIPYKFEDSHFEAAITWRDGGIHEDLAVARIRGKWNYKISVSDGTTGAPYQNLSWPPTSEVNGTPCPLRPGSNLGSRASFHRKLDFA